MSTIARNTSQARLVPIRPWQVSWFLQPIRSQALVSEGTPFLGSAQRSQAQCSRPIEHARHCSLPPTNRATVRFPDDFNRSSEETVL